MLKDGIEIAREFLGRGEDHYPDEGFDWIESRLVSVMVIDLLADRDRLAGVVEGVRKPAQQALDHLTGSFRVSDSPALSHIVWKLEKSLHAAIPAAEAPEPRKDPYEAEREWFDEVSKIGKPAPCEACERVREECLKPRDCCEECGSREADDLERRISRALSGTPSDTNQGEDQC
jgi:hypothetical protein